MGGEFQIHADQQLRHLYNVRIQENQFSLKAIFSLDRLKLIKQFTLDSFFPIQFSYNT